ncbi:OsmC family protein [Salinicola rhizosphaerae]|uniref:Osmotically inducible protein OsmC n=1 Tax=Salinicola rhizosphaerae TaxID=1443141 RepID=A0ABQ3EJQ8_9GAMM|nr:OsmC family protein [Salinicola rhizosphaerae]GHB34569.1 hypothetical protein GCM10009038_37130 [Salinicola rhizosphaerae]
MAASTINLELSWKDGFKGGGKIVGKEFSTDISIPAEYGGPGKGSNPKELYTASTAACFISTLTAMIGGKKLPLQQLSVDTQADIDGDDFVITHTANVVLESSASDEEVEKTKEVVIKADENCVVGNLARKAGVEVNVKPVVTKA